MSINWILNIAISSNSNVIVLSVINSKINGEGLNKLVFDG